MSGKKISLSLHIAGRCLGFPRGPSPEKDFGHDLPFQGLANPGVPHPANAALLQVQADPNGIHLLNADTLR
jgi:hypothetical protein